MTDDDDVADVVGERFTELVVRIVEGSDPVRGQIGPPDAPGEHFIGWSEFAAMIEQFRVPDDYAS